MRAILLKCRHYNIRLNPHKCVFFVETSRLLGFIISKDGIRIDPLKIESILALPLPTNVIELQSLYGKENFLCHFVYNYIEKTHGFMRLLKKDTPFVWDDLTQHAFNILKHNIMHASVLHPPNYSRD